MFGLGRHFSLKDLLSVKAIAIPGAVVQIAVATILGIALAWGLGWSFGAGLVFAPALSVASTVVLLRAPPIPTSASSPAPIRTPRSSVCRISVPTR